MAMALALGLRTWMWMWMCQRGGSAQRITLFMGFDSWCWVWEYGQVVRLLGRVSMCCGLVSGIGLLLVCGARGTYPVTAVLEDATSPRSCRWNAMLQYR